VTEMDVPPFTAIEMRQVMAHVPTAVAVVAAMTPSGPAGLTVGTFTSVSLDPPLVGFFPALSSTSWPVVEAAERFAISVLHEGAESICRQFAQSGGDKFSGLDWHLSPLGSPVLDHALAWFDCELHERQDAGDHWFVLARVHQLGVARDARPLVFCHGRYQGLGAPVHVALSTPEV
jgi:3-hydroxy-9,10-secoandrosta-1,3,5(10)-triene-9,17-dione monooxygenase reductase component